jgi:DNA-binding response OmpR family regulator
MPGREIRSGRVRMPCSPTEFRLLTFFLRYPDIVFSRMELLRRISSTWTSVDSRMIDVLIRRLRRKIELDPSSPAHLRTVQGLGYMFRHNSDIFLDKLTGDPFRSWPHPYSNESHVSLTIQ